MKNIIYPLTVLAAMFVACEKKQDLIVSDKALNNSLKETTLYLIPGSDPIQISKWKCVGGDTVFQDTLKLTLQNVWFDKKSKTEMHKYVFSYPVWNHCEWVATNYDAAVINQLSFSNEDCKTVYYQRLNN